MSFPQQWEQNESGPQPKVNENFAALAHQAVYAKDPVTSSALTWGYQGGRWGGFSVADGTLTLTDASTNYIVVAKSTGVISTSTSNTNWNNATDYARVYQVTTSSGAVSATQDHRAGPGGVHGGSGGVSGSTTVAIPIAVGDETTAITTGTAKVTFRMPFALTLTGVRASLTTAQGSGSILTVDINEGGTTILSTKLTIDNSEKTSTTAATPAVISDASLADDAEITIDIDQVGTGAAGLKVYLIGTL